MTNHPNRSKRGRPPLAPGERKRNLTLRLPPDLIDLIRDAGQARVETVLRAGLAD